MIFAVMLGFMYQGKAAMFRGIAESSETIISLPSPTEIVKVYVVPGQEIKAGDTIVVINRPDLTLRIAELSRELDNIEGRSNLSSAEIDQKVADVKANLETRRLTLSAEIRNLETELKQQGYFCKAQEPLQLEVQERRQRRHGHAYQESQERTCTCYQERERTDCSSPWQWPSPEV